MIFSPKFPVIWSYSLVSRGSSTSIIYSSRDAHLASTTTSVAGNSNNSTCNCVGPSTYCT